MSLRKERDQIRRALAGLPPGRGRRFTSALCASIARYARGRVAEGASQSAVASELGVSQPVIGRALQAAPDGLVPVRVIPGPKSSAVDMVVRTRDGLIIEGLDLDGLAGLIRALS